MRYMHKHARTSVSRDLSLCFASCVVQGSLLLLYPARSRRFLWTHLLARVSCCSARGGRDVVFSTDSAHLSPVGARPAALLRAAGKVGVEFVAFVEGYKAKERTPAASPTSPCLWRWALHSLSHDLFLLPLLRVLGWQGCPETGWKDVCVVAGGQDMQDEDAAAPLTAATAAASGRP